MNDKEITNAELLESMNKGFSNIEKRFSGVDKRFSGMETKISGIDTRLSGMETKISGVDTRLSGIETSNQEILESIIRSFSSVENKMATKDGLTNLELKLTTEIQNSRSDFKSFKKDTENDIKEIKDTTTDLDDTDMNYDKRIEKLENKVFA